MLKITKCDEPEFFAVFKKKNKPKNWADLAPVTSELRKYIMENEQTVAGINLCTYCEQKVTLESSHIDHVKPKDESRKYAKLFDCYENLTVSCLSNKSCGQKKDNDYTDEFINPIEENPSEFMTYEVTTGKIVAIDDSKRSRVDRTCAMLGLNSVWKLLNARRKILLSLNAQKKAEVIDFCIDTYKEFPTLIEFYRREFLS